MSIQAIKWALCDATGVPSHCALTLVGLANHADEGGQGSFPSIATLARYARKRHRQVQNDLRELEVLGLIRRGDQRRADYLPLHSRPTVYDLVLEGVQ